MKKGDRVKINEDVYAVSQKTQKPLAGRSGVIVEALPVPKGKFALQCFVIKVAGELLPFCSSEITKK